MRGLNVYCCPSCGHYGFFQLVANAVCPHCSIAMTPLPIPYQDFMDLDYPQRQVLISRHMLNAALPADGSTSGRAPFASPPKIPSHGDLPGRAVSPDKNKTSGKNASRRNSSPGKTKQTDKTETPGKFQSADKTAFPNQSKLSGTTESPEWEESVGRAAAQGNGKSAGKATTRNIHKSTGKNTAFDKNNSAGRAAVPDQGKSADKMVSPAKDTLTDTAASAFFTNDSGISKDSDRETLYREVLELREKNAQLEQTISWMHDLIWELTRRLHITQNT